MPLSLATIDFGPWHWAAFVGFMLVASAVDLGLGRRSKATMSTKSALMWCAVWVSLALTFNGWLAFHDIKKGEEFFQGYLLEYSLSVDNLFVFVLVFGFFKTPPHLQHRALVWGIIGAMILRATMILVGAALIEKWQWVLVLFGLFLVYTGIKMLFHDEEDDPSQSKLIQFLQRRLPLADGYREDKFLVREPIDPPSAGESGEGDLLGKTRLVFTRLFLVVIVIEVSDVMFAVDSVPAIFGVTKDPFVVFTSNMFAILGLRSLFFALSGAIQHLRYLNYGLSIVLCFIGLKMCAAEGSTLIQAFYGFIGKDLPAWLPTEIIDGKVVAHGYHMETWHSLAVICTLLAVTVAISLIFRPKGAEAAEPSLTASSSNHERPVVGGAVDDAPLSSSSKGTPTETPAKVEGGPVEPKP